MYALNDFFSRCDAVTYEFENVESGSLYSLEKEKPILPSVKVLRTCQDRILEKCYLRNEGFPHVFFDVVETAKALPKVAAKFGYPFILKTRRGGYDGKGQWLINSAEELTPIVQQLEESFGDTFSGIVEEPIEIATEMSCIVGRSPAGEEIVFPAFENIHREHILDMTIVPASVPAELTKTLQDLALAAARKLDVYGLLTTEFIISRNAPKTNTGTKCGSFYIYINEFAPRPHNSGHITRNACNISQFEALARILLSIPLSKPKLISKGAYCMTNMLGDIWLAQGTSELDLSSLADHPDVLDVVVYGKQEAKLQRKMGHFVTYGANADAAVKAAQAFKKSLLRPAGIRR